MKPKQQIDPNAAGLEASRLFATDEKERMTLKNMRSVKVARKEQLKAALTIVWAAFESGQTVNGFATRKEWCIDVVFTSPPYWGCSGIVEQYSDEPTQSHIRFQIREAWLESFIGQTIRNCHMALKPGGILALNVSDELAEDVSDQAVRNGFVPVETLRLRLSKMMGSKHKPGGPWKTEPVLVFRKP